MTGHEVSTTFEMGWASFTNGNLLNKARESFDAFITVDQNLEFQQNLQSPPLPVIGIVAADNRFESVAPFAVKVLEVLRLPLTRQLVRIESPERIVRLPERPLDP